MSTLQDGTTTPIKSFVGQNSDEPILDQKFIDLATGHDKARRKFDRLDDDVSADLTERLELHSVHFVSPKSLDKDDNPINTYMTDWQYEGLKVQVAEGICFFRTKAEALYWNTDPKEFAKLKKGMSTKKAKDAQDARNEGKRVVSRKMGELAGLAATKESRGKEAGTIRPLKERLLEKASTAIGAINKNESLEDGDAFPGLDKAEDLFKKLCTLLKEPK